MDRVTFANRATRLIDGRGRVSMAVAAVLAVALAGVIGAVLASRANQMQAELKNSQFVAQLTDTGERGQIAQFLADPDASELLLKYINAMAVSLANLEQSPREQLAQFEALLAAEKETAGKIEALSCAGRGLLIVSGKGDAQRFFQSLESSMAFVRVELAEVSAGNEEEFTINGYFLSDDL